ncbi:MAG: DUF1906 domain-containing protein [Solirubrobacterales bacterium]
MESRPLPPHRPALLLAGLALVLACLGVLIAPAGAAARYVQFDGRAVEVPRGWPVIRLAKHPKTCVRLDRRAVYLGVPSPDQSCPAEAIGRRRAILVEPRRARSAHSSGLPRTPRRLATASGAIFTGLGFDACATPSSKAMKAWKSSSPYQAIGVYIGGSNRACSQPNLTASWVQAQTEAGWHLIPTYVGLQAPTSACASCAKLSAAKARTQGVAAAVDAVAEASSVAMGPGSPIYFDMEAYSQTGAATAATLNFLEAWTIKLHQLGYVSGLYSSSSSGIEDVADQIGTGYVLPDQLWIANWNGQKNTIDPNVPDSAWTLHQRIHQYRGGHSETWGGVSIAIDNNYVDAATVGTASGAGEDDPIGWLDLAGTPRPGHLRVRGWAFDPNAPADPLSIRIYVGGRAGSPRATAYDLGPLADRERGDVGAVYPEAGSRHGFDVVVPVTQAGQQPVCAYGIDIDPGEDALLACKAARISPAVVLAHTREQGRFIKVWVKCTWPEGTPCPGQLALRTRFKVRQKRHGRIQTRVLSRNLGRRKYRLSGGRGHTFKIPITANGLRLLHQRGPLRTQLIAAISGGGRRYQVLTLDR